MKKAMRERLARARRQGNPYLTPPGGANAIDFLDFVCQSFHGYKAGWVHQRIAEALERFSDQVARGESPRLAIFMPPRHGKSFLVTERFPVWHLGRHPEHQIVCASYGQDLSDKFSKRARTLARDPELMRHFPAFALDPDKQAIKEWATTAGGSYKAVGVGGPLTGSGANILCLDDLVKDEKQADSETYRENTWEWYTHTAYTRLMPGGGVLLIMTRWHEDDIAGRLMKAQETGGDKWEVLSFPAVADDDEYDLDGKIVHMADARARLLRKRGEPLHGERWPLAALNRIKGTLGTRAWLALYQQKPSSAEGNMLKRHWWRYWQALPPAFDYIIQSWDLSFKKSQGSDFVVGQVWGKVGARMYLLYQVRGRMGFTETIAAIKATRRLYPQTGGIFVEDKANGPAVIDALADKVPGLIPVEPLGSKEARASAASPFAEAGNIYLPDPDLPGNEWVNDFVEEAAAFPRGANDDQVDAFSQAVNKMGTYEEFEPIGVSY